MKISTELRGIEDVDRILAEIAPREAKNLLRATVHGAATEIRDNARRRAPSDGPPVVLRKAIVAKRERGTRTSVESSVLITKGRGQKHDAFYWRFLERGTVNLTARPFIGPAVEWFNGQRNRIILEQFVKKLEARLARLRKSR